MFKLNNFLQIRSVGSTKNRLKKNLMSVIFYFYELFKIPYAYERKIKNRLQLYFDKCKQYLEQFQCFKIKKQKK